jgi:hypothetical protein
MPKLVHLTPAELSENERIVAEARAAHLRAVAAYNEEEEEPSPPTDAPSPPQPPPALPVCQLTTETFAAAAAAAAAAADNGDEFEDDLSITSSVIAEDSSSLPTKAKRKIGMMRTSIPLP